MKSLTTAALLAAGLILSACASTPEPTPPESAPPLAEKSEAPAETYYRTQSEAEAKVDDDDLICRTERTLGSRFPKKTCATKSQWEAARNSAQDEVRRNQKGAALQRN